MDSVVSSASIGQVVPFFGLDQVFSVAPINRRSSTPNVKVVVAVSTIIGTRSTRPVEEVISSTASKGVVAKPVKEAIIAIATKNLVIAPAALD